MITTIKPNANERSTYVIRVDLTDEDGAAVTPLSLSWTLQDIAGAVVNEREDVVIDSPQSSNTLVLEGDDLLVDGFFSGRRIITFSGTYNSTLANGVSIAAAASFDIDRLTKTDAGSGSVTKLIERLSVWFSDPDMTSVVPQVRVQLLNEAKRKVLSAVPRHFKHDLDVVFPILTLDANGAYDLGLLADQVGNGNLSLDGVRLTGGKFCRLISFSEWRSAINSGTTFTASDPVYYRQGGKICVDPHDTTIDLHYQRKSEDLVLDETDETRNIDCMLADELQDLMVEYAAYWGLMYTINNPVMAKDAEKIYLKGLAALTGTSSPTDSVSNTSEDNSGSDGEASGFTMILNQYTP